MNEFDIKASGWDGNSMHWERSKAVADEMLSRIQLNNSMEALEFGAGTGLLTFMLKDYLRRITLMDSSVEMIKVVNEKIDVSKAMNLKAVHFDLEQFDYKEGQFDLIFSLMALHHISDVGSIIAKFSKMLKPDGFLAIADLYQEDGSFHGNEFDGHRGFDVDELAKVLEENGFVDSSHKQCYVVNREMADGGLKPFPVFLLIAKRQ